MPGTTSFSFPRIERIFMLFDLFYCALTVGFFALCWLFTKACDRL